MASPPRAVSASAWTRPRPLARTGSHAWPCAGGSPGWCGFRNGFKRFDVSASIYWRSLAKAPPSFDVSAPSRFIEIMQERFGGAPWRVEDKDLPWLYGVKAADKPRCADWAEIISKVDKHGSIEIWPEY